MSTSPEPDFDLEKLFLPAWAQESPASNKYAKHMGDDRPDRSFDSRGRGGGGPRRDSHGGGRDQNRGPRDGGNRGPRRDGDRGSRPGGNFRRDERPERREAPEPLPQINITLMPDEKGVDSLARQIKMTGRAFPLFDIAKMILQKPERQEVKFEVIKKPDGQPVQSLFLCALDDSLWASQDEAISHVLDKHFATFYQAEKIATEPPKGVYTFVAQCGMSGAILGPPNYHDYQNQLRKLHAERFSRMPFEAFKSRVKIVKDEAVVKKWIEDQSFKTEYICLNVPDTEAKKLNSREEVDKHFHETHLPNIIKAVDSYSLSGPASRLVRSPGLQRLLRVAWEEQQRFPIKVVTVLSQQLAHRGLQFFKVNKNITHVCVARPHFLDLEATPVSDGVKKIVEFINATPKCTRRKLMDALAPGSTEQKTGETAEPVELTPEQKAINGDLHWLIHQGHVIEFANGIMETAKKPLFKPPQPKQKKEVPQKENSPEAKVESVPNDGMETIEPKVSEMEAAKAVSPEDLQTPATEAAADPAVEPVASVEEESEPAPDKVS